MRHFTSTILSFLPNCLTCTDGRNSMGSLSSREELKCEGLLQYVISMKLFPVSHNIKIFVRFIVYGGRCAVIALSAHDTGFRSEFSSCESILLLLS